MDYETVMNRINRFDEIGIFDMERVQKVYPVDKKKLEKLITMIYGDEEIEELVMNVIYMDDDAFDWYKREVKLKLGFAEFMKGFNRTRHLKLF